MKSDAYELQRDIWGIPGRGVLDDDFDLIDECLNGQVGFVRCASFGVVVLQVGGQNVCVGCVQMVQDGAGDGGAVAHVAVAEGTDENFVNRVDEHFSKGLVRAIVIIEDCGSNVIGVSKVGDLGARHGRWNGGIGARVNRSDESRGQECCVHGRGESELH